MEVNAGVHEVVRPSSAWRMTLRNSRRSSPPLLSASASRNNPAKQRAMKSRKHWRAQAEPVRLQRSDGMGITSSVTICSVCFLSCEERKSHLQHCFSIYGQRDSTKRSMSHLIFYMHSLRYIPTMPACGCVTHATRPHANHTGHLRCGLGILPQATLKPSAGSTTACVDV